MAIPVITNVLPVPGTTIGEATPILANVTVPAGALVSTIVTFVYPGLRLQELAYDGVSFTSPYAAGSTITAIVGGFQFSLNRAPVWPDSPTLVIYAVSDTGNLNVPSSYSWLIAGPPPPVPPGQEPQFPIGPGPGPNSCNGIFHDQQYFLEMFDRTVDPNYLFPIKTIPNAGYEIWQGFGAYGERVSKAIERLECGSFIIFAEGGSFATTTVEFYRGTSTAGAVIIKAGSTVSTSSGARDFITTQDAVFGALALGPIAVDVVAIAPGWEWNVTGQRITARGEVIPGEIDVPKRLLQADPNPPHNATFLDATIQVRQILDASGGAAPMLDGLGADRNLPRQPGETDSAYRYRIRQLPDVVSPDAINRQVHAILDPIHETFDYIETWQANYQMCWDCPSPNIGTPTYQNPMPTNPGFGPNPYSLNNLFVYDEYTMTGPFLRPPYDPLRVPPFYNRWLDSLENRGAFIIVVKPTPSMHDLGMVYDDPGTSPPDFVDPIGRRAYSAYDIPITFDPVLGAQSAYDGGDLQLDGVRSAIFQMLQKIKAGGVAAVMELAGQ